MLERIVEEQRAYDNLGGDFRSWLASQSQKVNQVLDAEDLVENKLKTLQVLLSNSAVCYTIKLQCVCMSVRLCSMLKNHVSYGLFSNTETVSGKALVSASVCFYEVKLQSVLCLSRSSMMW